MNEEGAPEGALTVRPGSLDHEQGSAAVRANGALERPQSCDTDPTGLEPHPLAELVPGMAEDEFEALKDDISKRGLLEPVVIYQDKILDGRHRLRACVELGIKPTATSYIGKDPAGFVVAKNLHRRHLTREQRREVVGTLLRQDPARSDRQVARAVGVDHKTVASVRRESEGRGEIPHVDTRTDTKGRTQPVSLTDGSGKPRRPPLPDQWVKARLEADRLSGRLQRLMEDDRFTRSRRGLSGIGEFRRLRARLDEAISALEVE